LIKGTSEYSLFVGISDLDMSKKYSKGNKEAFSEIPN